MISPPALPPKLVRRRRSWVRLSANPDVRSVQIGLVVTIILHLLLLCFAPRILSLIGGEDMGASSSTASRTFDIQLAPLPVVVPPPKPVPMKFVEANPNAPQNIPDKTENFAARNQQAAQEKVTPKDNSRTPASKGRDDSTAIVTGNLAKPTPVVPPAPKVVFQPVTPPPAPARRQQTPLNGFEKNQGDDAAGFGSDVSKTKPLAKISPTVVDGSPNATADTGKPHSIYYSSSIDPNHPQPRETLPASAVRVRPSPLLNNDVGTQNIGLAGYDAKWSSYGEYLQKIVEIVQEQWDRILAQSNIWPPHGTHVTVVFRINSVGKIYDIEKVSGTDNQAAKDACVSAIIARDPYGPWTRDMIATLGTSQELTYTFFYQ